MARKRLTPIRGRGGGDTEFRFIERKNKGTQWASCSGTTVRAFRSDYKHLPTNGFYLSNSDLGLIGLGLAAITPLALAYVGPASAYFITGAGGAVYSSTSVGGALLSSLAAGGLAGAIRRPVSAVFANAKRPCSEESGEF